MSIGVLLYLNTNITTISHGDVDLLISSIFPIFARGKMRISSLGFSATLNNNIANICTKRRENVLNGVILYGTTSLKKVGENGIAGVSAFHHEKYEHYREFFRPENYSCQSEAAGGDNKQKPGMPSSFR